MLAMSKPALQKFIGMLGENSILMVDSTYIDEIPATTARIYQIPCSKIAREIGKEMVANVVALGALAAATGVVTKDSLIEALMSRIPRGTEALNQKALDMGWNSASQPAA